VADIYGRHAAIQLSLIFFIFGSALSTGAQNMQMMLAGRGIAGVGAAGLIVVSNLSSRSMSHHLMQATQAVRVILVDSGSLRSANWQTSMLFFLYAIGYCIGPVLGGVLVAANFRWVFAIK
jgi:MFS family permease